MKQQKILFFGMLVILLSYSTYAIAPSQNYRGVLIKFYDDKINQTKCLSNLDKIPTQYLTDVEVIKIYRENKASMLSKLISFGPASAVTWTTNYANGLYYWNLYSLTSFNSCELDLLIHELAHHKNFMDGHTFEETNSHGAIFNAALEEIWANLNH